MEDKNTKRYMEMQIEELKEALDTEEEVAPKKKRTNNTRNAKNAEIAKLYEDAAEYEEEVRCFEEELEIVNSNKLGDIATLLSQKFPNEERDYENELKVVLETGWIQRPKEQLALINEVEFGGLVERLNSAYPDYDGDFEIEIREVLAKRWEMLIAIKKEHIKEEFTHIKTLGLKPNYAKRIYKLYHGIE